MRVRDLKAGQKFIFIGKNSDPSRIFECTQEARPWMRNPAYRAAHFRAPEGYPTSASTLCKIQLV
jgi:hypothetical protein